MATDIAYNCDECGKHASWEDSRCWREIEIKQRSGYGADIRRDLCNECWNKRKDAVIKALTSKEAL